MARVRVSLLLGSGIRTEAAKAVPLPVIVETVHLARGQRRREVRLRQERQCRETLQGGSGPRRIEWRHQDPVHGCAVTRRQRARSCVEAVDHRLGWRCWVNAEGGPHLRAVQRCVVAG
jgi:hypothetical protein